MSAELSGRLRVVLPCALPGRGPHRPRRGRRQPPAQDVAQEVFIVAQQRFPDPGRFGARGGLGEGRRGARAASTPCVGAGAGTAASCEPELGPRRPGRRSWLLERASRHEVRAALGRLPRRAATVLVLRHSGLSYAEVAEAMGVGTGQVGTMLRRAEAALRKEIERATRS